MADRETELLSQAIIDTEKEIAGSAWGNDEVVLDETNDRSVEQTGDGLEGQHEEDEEETEGEDSEQAEGEGETDKDGKGDESETDKSAKPEGDDKPETKPAEPQGRVPTGEHRKVLERARAAETERDRLKGEIETERSNTRKEIDTLKGQLAGVIQLLQQGKPQADKPAGDKPAAEELPDLFENPNGFYDHIKKLVQGAVAPLTEAQQKQAVAFSFQIAHALHKDTFEQAMAAVQQLDRNNPDDRATVQRILRAPDPGRALIEWHKRSETLREVGDDPQKYRERVAAEIMKDPEFRKQLLAEMRGEAATGDNGRARTEVRLPPSLNRATGSNLRAEVDTTADDGSDQAIAEAAWR